MLFPGEALYSGQELRSCDARTSLKLQGDGTLVLSRDDAVLWASSAGDGAAHTLWMQGDGNLVVYSTPFGLPSFASNVQAPGAFLAVQDDGNMVIYHGSQWLWATNTMLSPPPPPPQTESGSCEQMGTCFDYSGSSCDESGNDDGGD